MAKENDKYWYFRLKKEDILSTDVIMMKHVPAIGYAIFTVYMNLCVLSINTSGTIKIERTSTARGVADDLALIMSEPVTICADALSYLEVHGFIKMIDDKEEFKIVVPMVENNIGKSSKEADRIRLLEKNKALLAPPEEIAGDPYGYYKNVYLTQEEYDGLNEKCNDLEKLLRIVSISYQRKKKLKAGYADCLRYLNNNELLQKKS